MSNEVLEWIHQVLVNLVQTYNITQTYVDKWPMVGNFIYSGIRNDLNNQ